jgi:hypothetical protein
MYGHFGDLDSGNLRFVYVVICWEFAIEGLSSIDNELESNWCIDRSNPLFLSESRRAPRVASRDESSLRVSRFESRLAPCPFPGCSSLFMLLVHTLVLGLLCSCLSNSTWSIVVCYIEMNASLLLSLVWNMLLSLY